MAIGSILLFISFLLGNYYDNLVHPGESEEILHIFEARIHSFYQIEVQVKDEYQKFKYYQKCISKYPGKMVSYFAHFSECRCRVESHVKQGLTGHKYLFGNFVHFI